MAQALAQEGAAHRPRGGGARLGPHVFVTFENAAQPYADETRCNVAEAGLASFGKSIATAHGGSGLLANCAAPAIIETAMTEGMIDQPARADSVSWEHAVEAFLGKERPVLTVGRRGRPDEIAPVIALLCSKRAGFVPASKWRVDGGSVASVEM